MKRRYQIDGQRAVQEFRQLAHEQNPNLQMIVPMTEVVGLLQEGVGHLMREAGLALMSQFYWRCLRVWAFRIVRQIGFVCAWRRSILAKSGLRFADCIRASARYRLRTEFYWAQRCRVPGVTAARCFDRYAPAPIQ